MSTRAPITSAVMWPRLGPYHIARLQHAAHVMELSGMRLIAMETAETQEIYEWSVDPCSEGFQRELLFPQTDYCSISRAAIWEAVTAKLVSLDPEVVVVCGYAITDSYVAIHWARRNGRAVIVMSDSNPFDAPRPWYREWFKRQIVRLCDAALVAGSTAKGYMLDLGMPPDRIFEGCDVVDNAYFSSGVEVAKGAPRPRELPDAPYFLSVCRFVEKKNLSRLLHAYHTYCARTGADAWKLVLVGDGPCKRELVELRDSLGLQHRVFFPGFLQYEQLPTAYAHAAAFVLASTVEQWGLVVNEAMSSGLPVIVSRNAGCAVDLVQDGRNGWAVDPFSTEDLAERMFRLNSLPLEKRQEMGRASKMIIDDWGLERFADGLCQATDAATKHALKRRRTISPSLLFLRVLGYP